MELEKHNNYDRQLKTQNLLVLYRETFEKMKISKKQKIRFLCQKMCSVAREQTYIQTYRRGSGYRGHPFRVSGICPSTYHQGSVQYQPALDHSTAPHSNILYVFYMTFKQAKYSSVAIVTIDVPVL